MARRSLMLSRCCKMKLRWVKREKSDHPRISGTKQQHRTFGNIVHAYVCDGCGKADR